MILYNCKHDGDQFRISKFDEHMDVIASYLCTEDECDCPAGVRPTCRHRQMLPLFIRRKAIGSGWMLDFDRGGWVQVWDDPEPHGPTVTTAEFDSANAGSIPAEVATLPRKSWRRF
jgi:hypothetical protein